MSGTPEAAGGTGPLQHYRALLADGTLQADAAQLVVVEALDELHRRLLRPLPRPGLLRRLAGRTPSPPAERGLYLWGGVGRGKTRLVDLFYNLLPPGLRQRLHFHRFMGEIHRQLAGLDRQRDPLRQVASHLARNGRVLCLDEFIVTDIADAMILGRLLEALFQQGVTLVTTANTAPGELYRDGIQRASFLPAIELLKRHTRVLELGGGTDYRLRSLERSRVYHTPLGPEVTARLEQEFERLAPETGRRGGTVRVMQRDIPVVREADDLVWFDFMALCGPPRSQADYLELARCFHTVIISDIPPLGPALDDATRRFLYLLDEFYDRGVKLLISAAEPPESLYQGERLAFDFQRAASRLREMQTTAYLHSRHRG